MTAPSPYVWAGVALEHFLAALPLAVLLAAAIRSRCSPFGTLLIFAVCLTADSMILFAAIPPGVGTMGLTGLFALSLLRSLPALVMVLSAFLAGSLLFRRAGVREKSRTLQAKENSRTWRVV